MVRLALSALLLLPFIAVFPADEVFVKFSTDDGLSQNTVQVIHQDRLGFMWFGTEHGLNKFDGYQFKVYQFNSSDTTSFSDNIIRTINEDSNGRLWVGTAAGGLYLYDRFGDSFQHCRHKPFSKDVIESVYCMAEDAAGRIWIGSQNGLELFDPEKQTFSLYPHWSHLTKTFDSVAISALVFQGADTLWIGTANHGLWRLQVSSGERRIFQYESGPPNGISHNRISDMVMDSRGRLWLATYGGGLNLFDQQRWYAFKGVEPFGISDDNLFKVFLDSEENLFIGAEREGLYIINLKEFQPLQPKFEHISQDKNNAKGLGSNNIRAVYKDRQNNLWIGFFKGGLQLRAASRKRFEHFNSEMNNPNSLSNNLVNDIFEDSRGRIWIGTDGGGLNLFDPLTKRFTTYRNDPTRIGTLVHNHVLSIIENSDGRLWIGTWGGLALFDPQTGACTSFAHPLAKSPSLNNIFHLFADSRGMIWIGTYHGLEIFNPRTKQFKVISSPDSGKSSLTSNWVLTGTQDKSGNIWIGTRQGLNLLRKSDWDQSRHHFSHYLHEEYDPQNPRAKVVQTVFETSRGQLYAGALEGLYLYSAERDTFELVNTADDAIIRGVFRMLEDDEGSLWISTMSGLYKLDSSGSLMRFAKSDGLQSDEFASGACKSSTGQLYFGGVNGFNRFDPREIIRNETPPPVVLTNILIFNKAVPLQTMITAKVSKPDRTFPPIIIRPEQNAVTLEFAALDYANPYKIKYAYKIDGVDADWIYTDASHRMAAYRNLAGGTYTFHVRAANGDGVWNNDGLHLQLRVIPPFWKSNWALLLYVLSAAAILLLLRSVIVAKTHYDAELKLDQMKLNFFINISHEFRTPLTLILGPVAKILEVDEPLPEGRRRFYQSIISRNAKRLHHLVNQVMDLQKLGKGGLELERAWLDIRQFVQNIVESFSYLTESRQIKLVFTCKNQEIKAFLDADKLEKILYNLISNALDYTPAFGQVSLDVIRYNSFGEYVAQNGFLKHRPVHVLPPQFRQASEVLEIIVGDTGKGISPNHLPHIFDLFYRGDQETTLGRPGTGIGLALSRHLAELHGGLLVAASEVGKGSTFTLLIPVNGTAPERISRPDVKLAELRNSGGWIDIKSSSGDKSQILIIEDDADMRLYIADELSTGYAVSTAPDAKSGLAQAAEAVPDLIICDVIMPELSGFELCRMIKADQRTSHIPLILLTARTEEQSHIEGLGAGADDYVKKPFDASLLRARIANLLENRRRLQEQFSRKIFLQSAEITISPVEAQFLQKVTDVVEKHMAEEGFSVDVLAREIGLSRAQMYRKFHALTGQSPHELIVGLRLRRAAQLLKTGQFTTAEIAYQTGFSDPANFSKSFKKQYGQPPSRYGR